MIEAADGSMKGESLNDGRHRSRLGCTADKNIWIDRRGIHMDKNEAYYSTTYGGTLLFVRLLIVVSVVTLLINFLY